MWSFFFVLETSKALQYTTLHYSILQIDAEGQKGQQQQRARIMSVNKTKQQSVKSENEMDWYSNDVKSKKILKKKGGERRTDRLRFTNISLEPYPKVAILLWSELEYIDTYSGNREKPVS